MANISTRTLMKLKMLMRFGVKDVIIPAVMSFMCLSVYRCLEMKAVTLSVNLIAVFLLTEAIGASLQCAVNITLCERAYVTHTPHQHI